MRIDGGRIELAADAPVLHAAFAAMTDPIRARTIVDALAAHAFTLRELAAPRAAAPLEQELRWILG